MKFKLDENLPHRLLPILTSLDHDADTVVSEGFHGYEDQRLWPRIQETGRFLITKDLGFSDERHFLPGSHAGILVMRLSDDRSQAVTERLSAVLASESIETWSGCLVIVIDHKVRIRRPQSRIS